MPLSEEDLIRANAKIEFRLAQQQKAGMAGQIAGNQAELKALPPMNIVEEQHPLVSNTQRAILKNAES